MTNPTVPPPTAEEDVYLAAARAYMDILIAAVGMQMTPEQLDLAVARRAARPAFCAAVDIARAPLLAEIKALKGARLLSVIFGHHKGAPRPFALYRDTDVSGVSGRGVVAEGATFTDGTAVLRWLSDWPTSVVFHDRGIEAIEQIHGHGGATRIVWLSDELESLAEMEQQRDAARAELAAANATVARVRVLARAASGVWVDRAGVLQALEVDHA